MEPSLMVAVPNGTVPNGTAGQLMAKVCAYLSKPDPQIEV